MKNRIVASAASGVISMASSASHAQTVVEVAPPPGLEIKDSPSLSDDARVVAATLYDASANTDHAARWTEFGGFELIGALPGESESVAYAISGDGLVIVGESGGVAFRWTAATGMESLGVPSGQPYSFALAVNEDGSVIVGEPGAFRWTSAMGMELIPQCDYAYGVSADGQHVGGYVNEPGDYKAVRWSASAGTDIVPLPMSVGGSVSDDGEYVVGTSIQPSGEQEGFRWSLAGGAEFLGFLPGADRTTPFAATGDVSVIVGIGGESGLGGGVDAFRWTESTGVVAMESYLTSIGVNQLSNIDRAWDITHDGQGLLLRASGVVYVVRAEGACYADCDGNATLDIFDYNCFTDAFSAGDPSADCDGNGVLDIFDFLCFQNAFAMGCP